MVIELHLEYLLKEIRRRSHNEVSEITDPEARYRAEAGSEKIEDIKRCVGEGISRLTSRCRRYLLNQYDTYANNTPGYPDTYVYEFEMSERRALGKAEPLKEAMNNFVVEYALAKFYSTVSQTELSNKNSLDALATGNYIESLILEKLPPRM